MKANKKIRQEIFKKVAELFRLEEKQAKFIPGETPVRFAGRVYDEKELINLVDASLDFWLTHGRFAQQLEKGLAEFLGVKSCVLTNSGSSANLLAVTALTSPLLKRRRLKPGDEVITTACGFPTTLNPIIQNSLVPVFVDVGLGSYNIQADKIKRAVTKKTKAIFIAHSLGNPADLDEIVRVAKRHNLWFLEDVCDSLGSEYKAKLTGAFGHISTLSFYAPHHITMGEGGAVFTDDSLLKKIIVSFRDWGRDCWCSPGYDDTCGKRFARKFRCLPYGYDHKYVYSHIGYSLRATDLQAAIGIEQLKKLPKFISKRRENFRFLFSLFEKYKEHFVLPLSCKDSNPSWFGFPLLVKENAPFSRAEIVNYLEKNKIATRMFFGGNLIKQPAYKSINKRVFGSLKNTDLVMNNLFWLGVYPGIDSKRRAYIKERVDKFFKKI